MPPEHVTRLPTVNETSGHPERDQEQTHVERLQYLVDHDQLTGLLNREGFERQVGVVLATPTRRATGAVLKLGLDNFRHLNANLGHEMCDLVLAHVATVLGEAADEADMVARVGGDTFGMILPEADLERAERTADQVLEKLRAFELDLHGEKIRATASVGITPLDGADMTKGTVLLQADLAMAAAKEAGRDRFVVYGLSKHRPFKASLDWAGQIRKGLEEDSFRLYCQPVKSLTGRGIQWELLLRLSQREGQLLPPAEFLPTAERFGLMERIDRWVVGRAIDLIAERHKAGQLLRLEVNVATKSIGDQHFNRLVKERLAATGIDPGALIFEINESAVTANLDEVRILASRLKQLGCRFALDNFGTGFGSLIHLKQLPLDFVKIDGGFTRHLTASPVDQQVVRSLVQLAHGLNQQVIATFVGDDETVRLLEKYGVDYVQGFHVGGPRPVEEME